MTDYKNDKYIDLNKLEWECARMSDLFKKWGDRWADATELKDLAAEKVKLIRSQIIEDVRKNWKDLHFKKSPTGPETEAYYRAQPKYIAAKEDWVRAEARSRKLWIAMKSMEIKNNNLGNEQRLYHDEYWSTPYNDPGYKAMVEEETKTETVDELNKSNTSKLGKRLVKRS